MAEKELSFESRMYLSNLFLYSFWQRYEELVNAVSNYIAKFNELKNPFRFGLNGLKETLVDTIKRNLGNVVFVLETILSETGENKYQKELQTLKVIYDKEIVFKSEISLATLKKIQELLSKIAGHLLLKGSIVMTPSQQKSFLGISQPNIDKEWGGYYEEA